MSDILDRLEQEIATWRAPWWDTHAPIARLLEDAKAEIERLGRCNEQLSRSHAEVMNAQHAENKTLRDKIERLGADVAEREEAGREIATPPLGKQS